MFILLFGYQYSHHSLCRSAGPTVGHWELSLSLSGWFLCPLDTSLPPLPFWALLPFPLEAHFCRLFCILKTCYSSKSQLRRKEAGLRVNGSPAPLPPASGWVCRRGAEVSWRSPAPGWKWGCKTHFLWALGGGSLRWRTRITETWQPDVVGVVTNVSMYAGGGFQPFPSRGTRELITKLLLHPKKYFFCQFDRQKWA